MSSSPFPTVVVPVPLGPASSFDRAIFPLSSYRKRDSLGRGDLYLDATLDEMLRIANIGANPEQWKELIATTKARYDRLMLQKSELETRPKSKNPIKAFANYRAARIFLSASKSLYHATRSRSEEVARSIGRRLLSIPGEDMQLVDNEVSPDADLDGIVVRLDRPLDDTTGQQVLDAANTIASFSKSPEDGQAISDTSSFLSAEYVSALGSLASLALSDTDETAEDIVPPPPLPSPTIINQYNFYGSIYSPNSTMHGSTVNYGGERNSGSQSVSHTIARVSESA